MERSIIINIIRIQLSHTVYTHTCAIFGSDRMKCRAFQKLNSKMGFLMRFQPKKIL